MFEFDTRQWVLSHGRDPKGRGSWAFAVNRVTNEPHFSPSMTFTEAKSWIKNRVRPEIPADFVGPVTIYVLP